MADIKIVITMTGSPDIWHTAYNSFMTILGT